MSVLAPNNTRILSNGSMIITNYPYWSINLTSGNNAVNGVYQADMSCMTTSGLNGAETFYYKITPSGESNLTNIMWFILAIGILFTIFGFWREDAYTIIFGGFAFVSVGLYFLLNGIDVYRNATTYAISLLILFFGGMLIVRTGIDTIEELWG
jgi:hypothetical protein